MKALGWALFVASSAAFAQPVEVVDDAGRQLRLPATARRVVSLAPHLTELVFAAGGGARLVGVMRYSNHPSEASRLPVVGDAYALNFEVIAQLKPDLVLVWGSGLNDRQKDQLRAMSLPVYESEIRDVEGIARTLRVLGRLVGSAAAEPAASEVERRWQALRHAYEGRSPVRVFFQLWKDPLMTVNGDHLVSQAIAACGGVNAFARLPALTPIVSWEAAVASDPQLLVTAGPKAVLPDFGRWVQFSQVEAVRRKRFVVIDGDLIDRMGPRFVDGAAELCAAIEKARQAP